MSEKKRVKRILLDFLVAFVNEKCHEEAKKITFGAAEEFIEKWCEENLESDKDSFITGI